MRQFRNAIETALLDALRLRKAVKQIVKIAAMLVLVITVVLVVFHPYSQSIISVLEMSNIPLSLTSILRYHCVYGLLILMLVFIPIKNSYWLGVIPELCTVILWARGLAIQQVQPSITLLLYIPLLSLLGFGYLTVLLIAQKLQKSWMDFLFGYKIKQDRYFFRRNLQRCFIESLYQYLLIVVPTFYLAALIDSRLIIMLLPLINFH